MVANASGTVTMSSPRLPDHTLLIQNEPEINENYHLVVWVWALPLSTHEAEASSHVCPDSHNVKSDWWRALSQY